jgi:hypothetical protein
MSRKKYKKDTIWNFILLVFTVQLNTIFLKN